LIGSNLSKALLKLKDGRSIFGYQLGLPGLDQRKQTIVTGKYAEFAIPRREDDFGHFAGEDGALGGNDV
jgi:hypothetical protein